jgi:hypothetical protein
MSRPFINQMLLGIWRITGLSVLFQSLGTSTYKTAQDGFNLGNSSGWIAGGEITDNEDGTIAIAAGSGMIRANNSDVATLYFFNWEALSSLSLANNQINYIYLNYNSGVPNIMATTSKSSDYNTQFLLAQIYCDGTNLIINNAVKAIAINNTSLTSRQSQDITPYANASGGRTSASGARNIAISAGTWWNGLVSYMTAAFDSSGADRFNYWYRDGAGGWTKIAAQAQINNTQYDDDSGVLATLSNGHYGVHWIYINVNGAIDVIFGQGDYTADEAVNALVPSEIPPQVSSASRLISKITILKSASVFTDIENIVDNYFQSTQPIEHNNLVGLQGGAPNQYYHLDEDAYNLLPNLTPESDADFASVTLTKIPGSEFVKMETGEGVRNAVIVNKLDTTGATLATIQTFSLSADKSIIIKGNINAIRTGGSSGSGGDMASFDFFASYKNVSGTLNLLSSIDIISKKNQLSWDISFEIFGTNILLKVAGATNNNITWALKCEILEIQ